MSEEEWPIGTPRDEVLARVVSRGNRIVAVRRAFSVAMLASVVGVSALGAGTVISNMGTKGTETEQIAALLPEQPQQPGASDSTAATNTTEGSAAATVAATDSTTINAPGATAPPVTTASSVPGVRPVVTTSRPPSRPATTRPTIPTTAARPPATTTSVVAAPEAAAKPSVGNLRMKADGVPVGDSVCENEPESRVLVEVDEATKVQLSLNHGKKTRTVSMNLKGGEWSAEIGPIVVDPDSPSLPVLVTVVATGPGGVTTSSAALEVVDCTP